VKHYRAAIVLPLLMAVVDLAALAYAKESILLGRVCLDLASALGLWLNSKFIRYAAAVYFVLSLLSALVPLTNHQNIVWAGGLIWIAAIGIASAVEIYLLLVSKQFAFAFNAARTQETPQRAALRKAFLIFLALTAAYMTVSDIYNLTTQP
jgi:hypothetical protein